MVEIKFEIKQNIGILFESAKGWSKRKECRYIYKLKVL